MLIFLKYSEVISSSLTRSNHSVQSLPKKPVSFKVTDVKVSQGGGGVGGGGGWCVCVGDAV